MGSLSSKGLFGGLTGELKLGEQDLVNVVRTWGGCSEAVELIDEQDWHRGGSETYIAKSIIVRRDGYRVSVIGKAFVGWGLSPGLQLTRWEERRSLFLNAGIRVPHLYARLDGMCIEEYISHTLPRDSLSLDQYCQLGKIVAALNLLGLRPMAILSDLMCQGDELVYVDLGTDISKDNSTGWVDQIPLEWNTVARSMFERGLRGA